MRAPVSKASLETQFNAIAGELQATLDRLGKQIDEYRESYQRLAESGRVDDPATVEALHRLHRLELVADHIAASLGYLVGTRGAPDEHNEVREMAARVLESLETDRQRLYREVHDGPAQVLANAIFESEFFERVADRAPADIRAQLRSELANLRSQLRESLEGVRAMIFELRPPALAQLGLAEAMRAYAAELQSRFGINVETDLRPGPTGLSTEQELSIYRVLQEAMQNAHRHAHAQRVRVSWQRDGGRWLLTVSDDGIGFDPSRESTRSRSFGLLIMRERADVIGATLDVRSAPGAGTTVSLSVAA